MATAATISAIAALIGAGASTASVLTANNKAPAQAFGLQSAALQDSRNNEAMVRALQVMATQQGRSGFTDSQGNTVTYDPATNTWRTTTTPQVGDAQRAELAATLARNTTDQQQARRVNVDAERRSLDADLARGPALSEIQNYNPVSGSDLASSLSARAGLANEDAYRPLRQDLIRSLTRGSSAGGQPIADLASRQAGDLRKGILDAQISGQTGAADINKSNMASLLAKYTTLNANAQPTLQFPGVQGDTTNQTLATVAADRARTAATAPLLAAQVGNQATGVSNAAAGAAAAAVPSTNDLSRQLNSLSNILTGDKLGTNLATAYKGLFGNSNAAGLTKDDLTKFDQNVSPDVGTTVQPRDF